MRSRIPRLSVRAGSPDGVRERLRVSRLSGSRRQPFRSRKRLAFISRTMREQSQPGGVLRGRLQLGGLHERGACNAELPLAIRISSDQLGTHDALRHVSSEYADRTRRWFRLHGVTGRRRQGRAGRSART